MERQYGLRGVPGWATVAGTAFHCASEVIDLLLYDPMLDSTQLRERIFTAPRPGSPISTVPAERLAAFDEWLEVLRTGRYVPTNDEAPDGQGHTASEQYVTLWNVAFDEAIRQEIAMNPESSDTSIWRCGGRASKEFPDRENESWWRYQGPLMLAGFVSWREKSGFTLATVISDNGEETPAIELDVSGLIGDIPIEGRLDRVYLSPAETPVVTDLKSGSHIPKSSEQLGVYAVLLEKRGLPMPTRGAFYSARKGGMGDLHDLSMYSEDYFSWKWGDANERRQQGKFIASPSSNFCKPDLCGGYQFCYAVNGPRANEIPRPWDAPKPLIKETVK